MDVVADAMPTSGLASFSLKDAPSLIERVFPAQKVGIEAQKERKANVGQTLTALGSYWKGRKPLVLVRACLLASILPTSPDPLADLELFEALMRMDSAGLLKRNPAISPQHVWLSKAISEQEKAAHLEVKASNKGSDTVGPAESAAHSNKVRWKPLDITKFDRAARVRSLEEREAMRRQAFDSLSFTEQVAICERVERVERADGSRGDPLYEDIWERVNLRLGTSAQSLTELIDQLGVARFGRKPVVGDPFCGGGSIPFEAARLGFDVRASDLNPVATMLTWAALNIIGGDRASRAMGKAELSAAADAVEYAGSQGGWERSEAGDYAKAYLYCLETVDPQNGWRVPLASSWVVSSDKKCVAVLAPDASRKRFTIVIKNGATAEELKTAELGTVRNGRVVYTTPGEAGEGEVVWSTTIARLRGDDRNLESGKTNNRLRLWGRHDFRPSEPGWDPTIQAWVGGDVLLERLYCIQWMEGSEVDAGKSRPSTRFAAPTEHDLERESQVDEYVAGNLASWQADGLVPDMRIEAGIETSRLLRERGWTHWHHLFTSRSLVMLSAAMAACRTPATRVALARTLDFASRLSAWESGPAKDLPGKVFSNQALNTWFQYGVRSSTFLARNFGDDAPSFALSGYGEVMCHPVTGGRGNVDIWVFDPPYADAVHYHEITEFFIAWLRKSPPEPFDQWTWDSRRPIAIQGKGEKFRSDMVDAFRAMADRMPDNGLQVCMFTHQDAGVWADMAGIVWGAGLRVTAAWYVSTETTSELKKGGYVQGTVLLVLRKRQGDERAYKDELILEVRGAVQRQVDLLSGLNQRANPDNS
jgi:putative DNA methylase